MAPPLCGTVVRGQHSDRDCHYHAMNWLRVLHILLTSCRPTVCPCNNSASLLLYQSLPRSSELWRGHGQEAKRGEMGGPRITRNGRAMESFLLPCVATGVSLLAVWCLSGATPRGQPWTSAVILPHGRNGLNARRMAVLSTFCEPSLWHHVHRELWRSVLLDVTPIISATACHQRNYVERYSRSML